jgi:hypothetical protein
MTRPFKLLFSLLVLQYQTKSPPSLLQNYTSSSSALIGALDKIAFISFSGL